MEEPQARHLGLRDAARALEGAPMASKRSSDSPQSPGGTRRNHSEPLAPLLCVHPAAGRSGVAVGPHPLSCRATVDAELVVQVSEGALHEVVLLLSSLLRGSGAPRHVVAALPPSVPPHAP